MPLSAQARIAHQQRNPRHIRLWQALQPLKSVVRFMNSGAHPDDETTAMLAALAYRDGLGLSYVCSTRGEGGQNDIGTEATEILGVLRTAEMERACDTLGMRMYWLGHGPDDPIFDFGFSKSGEETLAIWGADHTLARFVDVVRREKPDILCPTFLDVPGQHGHHRAMTQMAQQVMTAAADPGFAGCDLPPWQIGKLYLPAWSGAGQAYDDDLPPPPATLTVAGKGCDPVTGWSYEQIGQHSRAFHRTQAMGHWVAPGNERDWPLHLARSFVPGPDTHITAGLPATLRDFADQAPPELAQQLAQAQEALDYAVADFPNDAAILRHVTQALGLIRAVRAQCPQSLAPALAHRLDQKEREIARVVQLAASVDVLCYTDKRWPSPGTDLEVTLETRQGHADTVQTRLAMPDGWHLSSDKTVSVAQNAAPHDGYRASYDPLHPPLPAVDVAVSVNGETSTSRLAWEDSPAVQALPACALAEDRLLINLARPPGPVELSITGQSPDSAAAGFTLPPGWAHRVAGRTITLTPPDGLESGKLDILITLDGATAMQQRLIHYDHIAPTLYSAPARAQLLAVEATLSSARVAYVGGGNDRVDHWLGALGADATALSDDDLATADPLEGFDTLVVGIFAMRFRPALLALMPRVHEWVIRGGTLVTLYHRPWDCWAPDTVPPARLEIGQPSLRWRVTDANATVTHLVPDHPLLNWPNKITDADWHGWHKERGLYFAKSWDTAYKPLLEMADPDEPPHKGALLAAQIGKGQHIHCALILHHQMEKLTPGAFRLMANLIAGMP